jgi:hypothetical protein
VLLGRTTSPGVAEASVVTSSVVSGAWVSPAFGVLAIAVSVAWRAISLKFVVGVTGGGVEADMVQAENTSEAIMALRTIRLVFFIELFLLVRVFSLFV